MEKRLSFFHVMVLHVKSVVCNFLLLASFYFVPFSVLYCLAYTNMMMTAESMLSKRLDLRFTVPLFSSLSCFRPICIVFHNIFEVQQTLRTSKITFEKSKSTVPEAFLYSVPNTRRTLLFSDKAWVYKRHFVPVCNNCSMALRFRAPPWKGCAALVLGSILVAASLETCFQQSDSAR